jgi:predicted metal-dependent enzyme (double-stranded beta helix superfamily)
MTTQTLSPTRRFIASVRDLCAEITDPTERWPRVEPLLRELLADPDLRARSRRWRECGYAGDRVENFLFYEDPDYGFVVSGLVHGPHNRTSIHDHAHLWTVYGVLDGSQTIERYERVDDGSTPGYADVRQTGRFGVSPGDVDVVPPYLIHAEINGPERTVAIILRSERPGEFLQGRYDPQKKTYWQGYGPRLVPMEIDE